MRDFFIRGLEIILNIIVILMIIGVVGAAGFAAFSDTTMMTGVGGQGMNGMLAGAFILVAGLIYVIFVAGFMYLGLGIYQNTKRTADLLANR